jgi:hypothetical protein
MHACQSTSDRRAPRRRTTTAHGGQARGRHEHGACSSVRECSFLDAFTVRTQGGASRRTPISTSPFPSSSFCFASRLPTLLCMRVECLTVTWRCRGHGEEMRAGESREGGGSRARRSRVCFCARVPRLSLLAAYRMHLHSMHRARPLALAFRFSPPPHALCTQRGPPRSLCLRLLRMRRRCRRAMSPGSCPCTRRRGARERCAISAPALPCRVTTHGALRDADARASPPPEDTSAAHPGRVGRRTGGRCRSVERAHRARVAGRADPALGKARVAGRQGATFQGQGRPGGGDSDTGTLRTRRSGRGTPCVSRPRSRCPSRRHH